MPEKQLSQLEAELAAAKSFDDALLHESTVHALIGARSTHLRQLVKSGRFPPPLKFSSRVVRYRAGDVKRWLASQIQKAAPL